MKADDNDKLWALLGKSRPPAVSPFFARNVLRAVRQEEETRPVRRGSGAFLFKLTRSANRWVWRCALAGTCLIAAVATVSSMFPAAFPPLFERHHRVAELQTRIAKQIVGNPDYEVIKHLDELVADEESSVWLDDSVH